ASPKTVTEGERGRERGSVEFDSFAGVPARHIGENHLIAGLETVEDFGGADGITAQRNRYANRRFSILNEFEQIDLAVRLCLDRPADVHHVFQSFELYGSSHAQVWSRAFGQRLIERHIHCHRAVLYGGVDANDVASDGRAMRVDVGSLIQ